MPMALQTQCNERVKISEANAWRMVYDGKTSRETSADHTTRLRTLKKLGFEEKGQLREWMTVARDRSAWGRKVEYKLELPPGSFTSADIERNTNDILTKLA
jgi:hypothetical protein